MVQQMMMLFPKVAGIIVIFILPFLPFCQSILPTAAIDISFPGEDVAGKTLLASQASFGVWPAMEARNNHPMKPVLPPTDDPLLCLGLYSESNRTATYNLSSNFVIIVPRGICSFEKKALNAQKLGASAIVIYGTLASRYSLNTTQVSAIDGDSKGTTDDVIYPQQYYDYDCDKANAEIPMSSLSFEHLPYDYMQNDRVLSGTANDGNICAKQSENFASSCESKRCLLTGDVNKNQNTMRACCAWDMHIWLYGDDALKEFTPSINVTAVYITMEQADELFLNMQAHINMKLTIYRRYQPSYNLSSILIWALGVFVASLAAWISASEYRVHKVINQSSIDETQPIDSSSSNSPSIRAAAGIASQTSTTRRFVEPEESLELTASHACGFILFSTAGLLTLFFLKIYNVVKIFYVVGCSGAVFQVIFYPLFHQASMRLGISDRVAFRTEALELGAVSYIQLMAASVSYGLGAVWIYIAFTHRHPDNILFYWIMQDVMGACMCIMFLSTMKLNSIKVASVLLMAAFFYDIFFVFVTPYLTKGGKSIMVDVATSGGPPKADPAWCEKYPDDKDCQGGDPLPMLLTVPRIFDYMGGSSLLGLGDIVLPGLLLSFAARYDEAKRLIGMSSREGRIPRHDCSRQTKDYFPPLIVAYGAGLAMANIAVYVMNMGQPALLYLVPSCLGTMSFLGWRRGELKELWNSPKVLASCDQILYGPVLTQDDDGQFDTHEVEEPTTSVGTLT